MRRDGRTDQHWTLPGVYLLAADGGGRGATPQTSVGAGDARGTDEADTIDEAGHPAAAEDLDSGRDGDRDQDADAVAIQGLSLSFLDRGVELESPNGHTVWACDWSDMAEISSTGSAVLPDGGSAVQVLALERNGGEWHLVVPTDDAEATSSSIRHRARSHGLRSAAQPPAVRRVVTVAVALLVATTVTVLLLSAAHVFAL